MLLILLADDHTLFSDGLEMVLKKIAFSDCEFKQAQSWCGMHDLLSKQKFDLVLTDLFMPGRNDWKIELAQLVQTAEDTPVCVISASSSRENVHKVFELGCKGYLHKSFSAEKLGEALQKVLEGGVFFPSAADLAPLNQPALNNYSLVTARQREILLLLAEGKSNQQIAALLNLEESTVKRHVYNICKTLQVRSRGEAVHVARQFGILDSV